MVTKAVVDDRVTETVVSAESHPSPTIAPLMEDVTILDGPEIVRFDVEAVIDDTIVVEAYGKLDAVEVVAVK